MSVTETGLSEQIARLQKMDTTILRAAEDGAEIALRAMADVLADYPPELPNQRYIRSYTLRDGWDDAVPVFTVMSAGLSASMTNPTPYGPEVEGEATQEAIFRGRWPTVEGVQREQEAAAKATIEATVQAGVRRG